MTQSLVFEVGDIVEFPKHAESQSILRPGSVILTQGAPGRYKVLSLRDGIPERLERVWEPGEYEAEEKKMRGMRLRGMI